MPNFFGLFGSGDRRRPTSRSRAYPQPAQGARRYERPELGRAEFPRPERRRREPEREVNWRRRGMVALSSLGVIAVVAGGVWLFRSDTLRVHVIDVEGVLVDHQVNRLFANKAVALLCRVQF